MGSVKKMPQPERKRFQKTGTRQIWLFRLMWVNKDDDCFVLVRVSTRKFKGDTGYKTVCLSYPEYIRYIPGGEDVYRYITLENKERMKTPENQKVKFSVEFEIEVSSDTVINDTLEIVKRLYSDIPEYTGKIEWRMK